MSNPKSAFHGHLPAESEFTASDALVMAAPSDLPPDLVAHLPLAQASATQNMAAVKRSSVPYLEHLAGQLRLAQTPSVPKNAKLIRLRHIAGEWSKVFSPKTACGSLTSTASHQVARIHSNPFKFT